MLKFKPSDSRGSADHGWLHAKHSFSFAEYFDPENMGFRSLRVINEDRIEPAMGFGTHGHKDMEIVTYIVAGALAHKDSMGNGSVIRPGDVQYMSAGTGVKHSEFNHSQDEQTHLLQIWILPDKANYQPRYDQKTFSELDRTDNLKLVVSGNEKDNVIHVHQDVYIYASLLSSGKKIIHETQPERGLWLQMVKGEISVNGQLLSAGDAIAAEGEKLLTIEANQDAEFLLFDLK